MKIIKNKAELRALLNEHKDLILPREDVRIEYQVKKGDLRNVRCRDLFLMNDDRSFDFDGGDFNGGNFNGGDFNGGNFNGGNFNGWNFNGGDFNGGDFNGGNFNGWNFDGGDFNGWNFDGGDFNGGDFNGGDFNGGNFNGGDFNGKKVSYYAFFNCYGSMKCTSYKGRRMPHAEPITLGGKIEII